MKKLLIIATTFMFTSVASALSCGETKTESSVELSSVEVTTAVPKNLRGASILLTKADGSTVVLKAEDYMIVKRKHSRPVVTNTTKEASLSCKEVPKALKNIVSVEALDGYSDITKEENLNSTTLRIQRKVALGLQYQRAITERFYLGGQLDTNRGAGILLGMGF